VAQLAFRFRSGAVGQLFASLASPIGTSHGILIGEKGTLRYDHGAGQIEYQPQGEGAERATETVTRASGESGYLRELRSFTHWVLYGTAPLLTAQEGRAAIQVVEAAYQSAATGRPVAIGG